MTRLLLSAIHWSFSTAGGSLMCPARVCVCVTQDPSVLASRLQSLRGGLAGLNVTAVVGGAPRVLTHPTAADTARQTLRRLQEAIPGVYVYDAVAAMPRMLLRDFDKRIAPLLAFLAEALPQAEVGYILNKNPRVLGYSITARLHPRLEALKALLSLNDRPLSGDNLAAIVMGHPLLFDMTSQDLASRVTTLRGVLPAELLVPTLARHPRTWTADPEEVLGPQVALLRTRLSSFAVSQILRKLPSALYYPISALERKLAALADLGFAPEQVECLLTYNPMILALDIEATLRPKMAFLRSVFGEMQEQEFVAMMGGEPGSKALTAGLGRLGRLAYIRKVQPWLNLEAAMRLVTCGFEDVKRKFPG
jgi:hypothetical protein